VEGQIRHNCGIVVTHTLHDAHSFLSSIQHRGREAAGIAAIGPNGIDVVIWSGKVDAFDYKDLQAIFPGTEYHTYFAHVRYATRGRKDKILEDAHPQVLGGTVINRGDHIFIKNCDAAIIHNGQISLADLDVGKEWPADTSDTKAALHYYWKKGAREFITKIKGAFTVAIADKRLKHILVMRDQHEIRPGVIGRKDEKYVIASEDIAFRQNGANRVRDLRGGSIYYMSPEGDLEEEKVVEPNRKHCVFEYQYIGHVDSVQDGVSVQFMRSRFGHNLAKEHTFDADIVSYIPRCPTDAAIAYAHKLGLPCYQLFYKKRGERSFQGSDQTSRQKSIKSNLGVNPRFLTQIKGKRIILMDDSIIRGTNSAVAIQLLKDAGASEVFMVAYTPKIGPIVNGCKHGCMYGVDMPPTDNFIARDGEKNRSDESISRVIGVTTKFASLQTMFDSFADAGIPKDKLCYHCMGGPKPF
jgi:amidophosphoribosyltransferase